MPPADVPGLPSSLIDFGRRSTPSSSPSTATRCEYNTRLHTIAKELANRQEVEDSLRSAVHAYVLLETPRMGTPTGAMSTGSSASGVQVSKGVQKLRKYIKAGDRVVDDSALQQDAVLTQKAELNLQRYTEYKNLHQMRRMDTRQVFAAAVQQVKEEEDVPEDDRVATYTSMFHTQIPESILQKRASMKLSSSTPSSGSSATRRLPSRAARSATIRSPASGSRSNTSTPPLVTPSAVNTPNQELLTGDMPIPSQDSLRMKPSLELPGTPSTPPDTLLNHHPLHHLDSFVPETIPASTFHSMRYLTPPHGASRAALCSPDCNASVQSPSLGRPPSAETSPYSTTGSHPDGTTTDPKLAQHKKTARITFSGFNGDVEGGASVSSSLPGTATDEISSSTGRGQACYLTSLNLEGSGILEVGGEVSDVGLELSVTALETVSETAEEHACMGEGGPGSVSAQDGGGSDQASSRQRHGKPCTVDSSNSSGSRQKSWKKASSQKSERLLTMGSFQSPFGHRRLARRESDIQWLNMAMQEKATSALTVSVRKPQHVPWEVWSGWSDATQLAYINGEDLTPVCAPVRSSTHLQQAQALMSAVMEANAPMFSASEAMEVEREATHCTERARMKLQELGVEGAAQQAATLHSYKEAISDLHRARPVFRPCKASARSPLPAQRAGGGSVRKKKAWTLSSSKYFGRRRREAESRDFGDMDAILSQQFSADWGRVAMKHRFVALVGRSDKDRLAGDSAELQAELNEVRECMEQHKLAIMMMMVFYSSLQLGKWSSTDMKELDMDMFRSMVRDFHLIDPQAPTCRSLNELDSIFVATNFEEGVATAAEDAANDDNALVQFELYEILVRLAFAKFINSKEMSDASDAVDRLMEEYVLPNVPEEVLLDPNEFRFNRMYTEDVEAVLLKYDDFLHAVFQVYKAADRTKWFWIEHFKHFLDVVMLLKDHEYCISEQDARLLFCWSQSTVRDELRNRQRAVSLMYPDFVELVCRLADHIGLPSKGDLEHFYGGRNHLPPHPWGEYYHRQSVTGVGFDRRTTPWWSKGEREFRAHLQPDEHDRILYSEVFVPLARRPSCENILSQQTRPLHIKLAGFLDVLVYYMKDEWGGTDLRSCTAEMMQAARHFSGDRNL